MTSHKYTDLPDIDTLHRIAKEKPEELELIRTELSDQIISRSPLRSRKKLLNVQRRINNIVKNSDSALHSCALIHSVMIENVGLLAKELEGFSVQLVHYDLTVKNFTTCSILTIGRAIDARTADNVVLLSDIRK